MARSRRGGGAQERRCLGGKNWRGKYYGHTRREIQRRNWRKYIFFCGKLRTRMIEKLWGIKRPLTNFKMPRQKTMRNLHQRQWKQKSRRNVKEIFSQDHSKSEWQDKLEEQQTPRLNYSITNLSENIWREMNFTAEDYNEIASNNTEWNIAINFCKWFWFADTKV